VAPSQIRAVAAAVIPGVSGGPVLNEQGRVLGVVSARLRDADGIGMASRIRRAELLLGRLDQGPPPPRLLRLDLLELAFLIQWAPSPLNGVGVGAGWRLLERYPLQARLGYLAGSVPSDTATVLHEDLNRFEGELTLGYALPLSQRLSLSVALGASLARDHATRDRLASVSVGSRTACSVSDSTSRKRRLSVVACQGR